MSRHAHKTANRLSINTSPRGNLGLHSATLRRLTAAGMLGRLTAAGPLGRPVAAGMLGLLAACAAGAPLRSQDQLANAETQLHVREQITSAEAELQAAYVQLFPEATQTTESQTPPAPTSDSVPGHSHHNTAVALSGASIPTAAPRHINGPTCEVAAAPRCQDTCTLARSICNSANRICQLAVDLSDDWAHGKCDHGAQACTQATTRCCGCK